MRVKPEIPAEARVGADSPPGVVPAIGARPQAGQPIRMNVVDMIIAVADSIRARYSRVLQDLHRRAVIADPGLLRLRNAARSALATFLSAALASAWALHHHLSVTVAALGVLFAMIAPLFLRDARLSGWMISLGWLYATACACFAGAAAVAAQPAMRGAGLLFVVFAGMLCQRSGPRAIGCAMLALVAFYLGLYLHPAHAMVVAMLAVSACAPVVVTFVSRVLIPVQRRRAWSVWPTVRGLTRDAWRTAARFNRSARRGSRFLQGLRKREQTVLVALVHRVRALAWLPAIPATLAAAVAMLVGSGLSEERWMWAVISTFVVFLGTTSREHTINRAMQRLAGTFAGALVSALVVTAFRHTPGVLAAAMVLSVFGWAYYIFHAYARGVFFITVLVGLVYGSLGFEIVPLARLRVEEVVTGCLISLALALLMMPSAAARRVQPGVAAGQ